MREILRPDQIEVPISPTIMGTMSSPDSAAEVPEDICRNVGTNAMAANIPSPRVRPIAVALTNTGLRNRPRGMIGSSARVSFQTNSAVATTMPPAQAQVAAAPQPCSALPPNSVKKMRQVVATDSSSTPATSILRVARLCGRVRVNHAMAKAAMPMGMLM